MVNFMDNFDRNVKEKMEKVENFFIKDYSGNTCLHLAGISGNLGNFSFIINDLFIIT